MSTPSDKYQQTVNQTMDLIEKFIYRVVEKIRHDAVVISAKHVDRGYLRNAIVTNVVRNVGSVVGMVGIKSSLKTRDGKPYGIFVHEGTRPHFPPLQPLQQWIHRKGLISAGGSSFNIKTRKRMNKSVALAAAEYQFAYNIARKIARKGTPAFPFLRMALNQNFPWIVTEAQKLGAAVR